MPKRAVTCLSVPKPQPPCGEHSESRASDFDRIQRALRPHTVGETECSVVAEGDSLTLLRLMPGQSVSLIVCDPPYHTTRKPNIRGDRQFSADADYLNWMAEFADEWRRVLRVNGTLYLFCSPLMSARLEVALSEFFNPISHITWTKPNDPGYDGWKNKMKKSSLRRWYPHSERILVFEHGDYAADDMNRRTRLGQYLRECRVAAGMSTYELAERVGAHGAVNHGGAVSNWETGRGVPSMEQYRRVADALEATGKVERMPPYQDIVRPMNLGDGMEFTDVWNFKTVRPFRGKHPAQKPLDMLLHIVAASSNEGDVVLDCFAGSGSTGVAAVQSGRRAVCMEVEGQWAARAAQNVAEVEVALGLRA